MSEHITPGTLELAKTGEPFAGTLLVVVTWETEQPDLVAARYPELKAAIEEEPGCISFDVYRSPEDPRVFRLIERYRSLEAFDTHRASEHFQRIMQGQIAPLLTTRDIVVHQL